MSSLQFWLVLCVCASVHAQRQEARSSVAPTESPTIFYIPIRFRTLSPATSQPTTSPTVDSLNFPVYEPPQEVSRVSCQELQWSVTPTGVCLGTGEDCSLRLGWEASRDVCESMGARLCTATELSLFDAKQGCTIDNLRVWTSTRCLPASARMHLNGDGEEEYSDEEKRTFLTAGYVVSQAASSDYLGITKAMCERDARQQNVRCCADAQDKNLPVLPLNQTTSQSTCAQLEWEPVPERSFCRQPCNQNRCLTTTDNHNAGDNSYNCTPSSLSSAIEQCTLMGARLCSVTEIDTSSECLSKKQIWTRSSCANQSVYVVGSQGMECVPISRRYYVQCCAGIQLNTTTTTGVISNSNAGKTLNTCMQLGWAGVSANSCASDRVVESACRPNVDFNLARRICTDLGARLCVPNEIRAAIPLLSGCLSNGFVWTSQPGCEFSFSMAIAPNNNDTICLPQQALNAGVICCADGTPRPPTLMPTSFPSLRPTYSPMKPPSTLAPSASPTRLTTTPPSRRPRLEVALSSPAPTSPTISLAPSSPPTWSVCDRNTWPTIKGMRGVCILTKPSVCRPPADWWTAVSYCEGIGARLCTASELTTHKKDKTRQGCGSTRVWAQDACVKSGNTSASVDMDWPEVAARKGTKLNQLKTAKDPNKEHCDIKTASLQVACCSATAPSLPVRAPVRATNLALEAVMNELKMPVARSAQTCQQLGWNVSKSLPLVCAASKIFAPSFLNSSDSAPTTNINVTVNGSRIAVSPKPVAKDKLDCSPLLSFPEATRLCASLHARLCTSWELAQGVGQNTGCQLDSVRVWTQTPCWFSSNNSGSSNVTSAVLTQGGAGLAAVDLLCKPTSQDVYPVRCCADP